MKGFLDIPPGHVTSLPSHSALPERFHEFDERSIVAVNAALAARRPLLVRGEPGVGKTQLAEAVATELKRAFYSFTVDARTESQALLWRFDAVMRLAQAQLCAALKRDPEEIQRDLAVHHFVYPGPLWWAFNATTARAASPGDATTPLTPWNETHLDHGWVVLIDEIDKAETDVPNGLLEALGAGQFTPFGSNAPVTIAGVPPLIMITTNQERVLPDAFVRRCLVLPLALPTDREALIEHLVKRGKAHFQDDTSDKILREAAQQLVADRHFADEHQLKPLPGQAEYLDLVRAVIDMAPTRDFERQKALITSIARFTLKKHDEMWRRLPEVTP